MRESHFITVGLGPVGRTLTAALREAGFRAIALVGRGREVEKTLARKVGGLLLTDLPEDLDNVDFIVAALPTSRLAVYARELSVRPQPWQKLIFLHASGSLGIEPFQPLADLGAGIAAMHPYQTFPKSQSLVNLHGITWGITGNRRGVTMAREIVRRIGGVPLTIREKDRLLYHISAIFACTFVAADIAMAVRALRGLGVSERRSLQTVLPIAEETIRNIKELGIRAALTGPQSRGDAALIRRHIKELRDRVPELAAVYRAVSDGIMKSDVSRKSKLGR